MAKDTQMKISSLNHSENDFSSIRIYNKFQEVSSMWLLSLPKTQRTQGIESFNSIYCFDSIKTKCQKASKSWPNLSLVLFSRGQEIHVWQTYVKALTNSANSFDKSIQQVQHLNAATLIDPIREAPKKIFFFWNIS